MKIGYVGLMQTEVLVLKSLERILAVRPRPYRFEAAGDLESGVYLVDAGDTAAVERWGSIREHTKAPVILVSDTALDGSVAYSIARPSVAARVLAALDNVIRQEGSADLSAA